MSLTPHRQLSAWYQSIAPAMEAGVPIIEVMEMGGRWKQRQRARVVAALKMGEPFDRVIEASKWLPVTDRGLMAVGSLAGRLPTICRQLAAQHEEAHRWRTRMVLALAYPVGVVHFGAVAVPLGVLFSKGLPAYLGQVFTVLGPIWVLAALGLMILMAKPGAWRWFLSFMPLGRGLLKARDLATISTVLEAYVSGGASLIKGWTAATNATGSRGWRGVGRRVSAAVEAGQPPGSVLPHEGRFPNEWVQLYQSGEKTGALDQNLLWLARDSAERAGRRLQLMAIVYPVLVFIGVAAWVGYVVISSYMGYLNQALQMANP